MNERQWSHRELRSIYLKIGRSACLFLLIIEVAFENDEYAKGYLGVKEEQRY